MKYSLLMVAGIVSSIFATNVSSQDAAPYHSCDNVVSFVEALVTPSLSEEQRQLLRGVLRTPGVTQFNMALEPENRNAKSLQFHRRINPGQNETVSSFQLRFGQTILNVENESTCEIR